MKNHQPTLHKISVLFVLFFASFMNQVNSQDCISLACNNIIEYPQPLSGEIDTLYPSDFTDGAICPNLAFSENPADTILIIDENSPSSQQVTITDTITLNSCWGTLNLIDCSNDLLSPVAICDNFLHVSLDEDGLATIGSEIIDNGSFDNCSMITLQVRRSQVNPFCDISDGVFGDEIHFCCGDSQDTTGVELLVTDGSGNTAFCFTEVAVRGEFGCANFKGQIFESTSCLFPGDRFLPGWIVTATNAEGISKSGISNETGEYFIYLDPGTYTVSAAGPGDYWSQCQEFYTVVIADVDVEVVLNVGETADISCPIMNIENDAAFFRRCFENTVTFKYANWGTDLAENAYLDISHDPLLSIVSSQLPFQDISPSVVRVQLGDIAAGIVDQFAMQFFVNCDANFGQSLCIKSNIYPDEMCYGNPAWSGANLIGKATCEGDSVKLEITNNSNSQMNTPHRLYVIEEDIIIFMQDFNLLGGETVERAYISNGNTFLIASPQEVGHPNDQWVIAGIEACSQTTVDPSQLGFLNNYALNSGNLHGDILCLPVIGSYDPNDKAASPIGYAGAHKVLPESRINYKIRFQNTGTDTAFTVIVKDVIDTLLDISSIRFGGSSHDYEVVIGTDNELAFVFNNIMLPDSNVNLIGSNGYLTYSIKVSDRADIGSIIYNEAAIYFDFNEPVITNQVFHTIDTNFIEIQLTSGIFNTQKDVEQIIVSPNPASNELYFHWNGQGKATATVFNLIGK